MLKRIFNYLPAFDWFEAYCIITYLSWREYNCHLEFLKTLSHSVKGSLCSFIIILSLIVMEKRSSFWTMVGIRNIAWMLAEGKGCEVLTPARIFYKSPHFSSKSAEFFRRIDVFPKYCLFCQKRTSFRLSKHYRNWIHQN